MHVCVLLHSEQSDKTNDFQAGGSRAVTEMLKNSKKGARGHEISKLIPGYLPFFRAITGCN